MKTTFPNLQNMHENALNHDVPSNHDDHDDGLIECNKYMSVPELHSTSMFSGTLD